MALIFALAYQHHDRKILEPVATEIVNRGHVLMTDFASYAGFVAAIGPKALILSAEFLTFGHAEGLYAVKMAYWARNGKVPSIAIMHGIPFGETPVSTSDVFCTWGHYWNDYVKSDMVVVTGNPAMDVIADYDRESAVKNVREIYGDAPKAMLTPALTPDPHNATLRDMPIDQRVDMYIEEAKKTGFDGLWLVRPHPADPKYPKRMEMHETIRKRLGGVIQSPAEDLKLYDILCDIELALGTSTVVFEAFAFGAEAVPVLLHNWPADYKDHPQDFLYPYPLDGKASSRVADVVEDMIENV